MAYTGTDVIQAQKWADLLWTNSSPNTGFSAQTVALDLSAYEGVVIITKLDANRDFKPRMTFICDKSEETYQHLCFSSNTAATNNTYVRATKITDSGVEFKASTGGSAIIPLYIFGIKHFYGIDDYIMGTEV